MRKVSLIVLLFLAFPMLAWAADYYVSTTGNDSTGDGSIGNPWLTIQKGITDRVAGDFVYVRGGTYRELAVFNTSGSVGGGYITLKNYADETPVMDGSDAAADWGGVIQALGKSYLAVDGMTITGCAQGESMVFAGPGSHIIIQNCEIYDHTGYLAIYIVGQGASQLTHVTIDNCVIHDADTGGYEAIRFDQNVRYFKATNNLIYDCTNIGIDSVSWSADPDTSPTYGLYKGNTVTNVGKISGAGNGLYVDGGNFITIQDNYVYDNSFGISTGAENAGNTTTGCIVRNNYVYRNVNAGITIGQGNLVKGRVRKAAVYNNTLVGNSLTTWSHEVAWNYSMDGNVFFNNNIYDTGDFEMVKIYCKDYFPNVNSMTANYNGYYPEASTYQSLGGNFSTLTAYQSNANPNEANSISSDPLFVDWENDDYDLTASSPYIDAGGPLADTTDGGTGTAISVDNAAPFTDGYDGLFSGDVIRVGTNTAVTITAVDIEANTITVHTSISWIIGDSVCMDYSGSAPDIGAFEYQEATATPTPTAKRKGHGILGARDGPMWPHYLRH